MDTLSTLAEWLSVLEQRHPLTIDLGLERVRLVWEQMGCPRAAASIITVAGTNGKGSTCAYISSMLEALGYRQGCYTSPHLLRYNERICIAGEMVSDQELLQAFERVEAARQGVSLTYFEFGTLAAIWLFSQRNLDFAVLEVGLGGRLDAVNVVDADCAVITPIGLDHTEYLGPDRESIGREKAGIIRAGKPAICAESEPPRSVLDQAEKLGASVQRLGREFTVSQYATDQGLAWLWQRQGQSITLPRPSLQGPHQVQNMATAVAAVVSLVPESLRQPDALSQGLSGAKVAGRLQPLAASPLVLVDVGHNPLAAEAVALALDDLHTGPVFCVLGMLKDKDARAVAEALGERVERWYCAGLEGERKRSGSDLADEIRPVAGEGDVIAFADVPQALGRALADASSQQCILVFGSFVTAAQASQYLAGLAGR